MQVMFALWRGGFSINNIAFKREMRVYPIPDPEMYVKLLDNYEMLIHWLPGECDNCRAWVMQRTECYWGSHPHYCPHCLQWAINIFETKGKWPDATWHEGEV